MADQEATGVKVAAGGTMAAIGATTGAEVYVRLRAARRLGPTFVTDTRALLSPAARKALDSAATHLDPGHAGNLKTYTDYDYVPLNRFARKGEVTKIAGNKLVAVTDAAEAEALSARYASALAKANEGIAASTLPERTTLFRAMGTRGTGELKPGSVFTDSAIQSTTTRLDEASHFYDHAAKTKGRNPVMMVIDASGKKGLNIAPISQFAHEAEVVLPAGTTYQVDRVEKGVRRSLFEKPKDYVFASIKGQDTAAAAVVEASRASRFSQALGVASKVAKGGLKALMPVLAGAAAVSAFSRTGSAAEAGKAAGDVVTSGAVSFYDQAKNAGMSDARAAAEATVRGAYNTATFGLFENKLTVPGSDAARRQAIQQRLTRFSPLASGPQWTPGQMTSESRATRSESNNADIESLNVVGGGIHSMAKAFYGAADLALYHSRVARGLQGMPFPGQGKAYLNAAAQKKAEAPPAQPAPTLRTAGPLPRSDGQTDTYTRIDPRTGKTVQVKGYATPKR